MRRHKYGAVRCEIDGEKFDSRAEAARWQELKLLEKAGEIQELTRQPEFDLTAGLQAKHIGKYVGDFSYIETPRGRITIPITPVVEDVKGFKTPLYRWKKKHVEAQYGIQIREITGRRQARRRQGGR